MCHCDTKKGVLNILKGGNTWKGVRTTPKIVFSRDKNGGFSTPDFGVHRDVPNMSIKPVSGDKNTHESVIASTF